LRRFDWHYKPDQVRVAARKKGSGVELTLFNPLQFCWRLFLPKKP
jgi:hypothetical protein